MHCHARNPNQEQEETRANDCKIPWPCAKDENIYRDVLQERGTRITSFFFRQSLAHQTMTLIKTVNQDKLEDCKGRGGRRTWGLLCGSICRKELHPNHHCCSSAAQLRNRTGQTAASLVPPSSFLSLSLSPEKALLLFSCSRWSGRRKGIQRKDPSQMSHGNGREQTPSIMCLIEWQYNVSH